MEIVLRQEGDISYGLLLTLQPMHEHSEIVIYDSLEKSFREAHNGQMPIFVQPGDHPNVCVAPSRFPTPKGLFATSAIRAGDIIGYTLLIPRNPDESVEALGDEASGLDHVVTNPDLVGVWQANDSGAAPGNMQFITLEPAEFIEHLLPP